MQRAAVPRTTPSWETRRQQSLFSGHSPDSEQLISWVRNGRNSLQRPLSSCWSCLDRSCWHKTCLDSLKLYQMSRKPASGLWIPPTRSLWWGWSLPAPFVLTKQIIVAVDQPSAAVAASEHAVTAESWSVPAYLPCQHSLQSQHQQGTCGSSPQVCAPSPA